jgi:NOL1/NOP2/sun family putative RNA methylase
MPRHLASVRTPEATRAAVARYRDLIDDWPAFLDAVDRPLPPCVWANPTRIGPDAFAALLGEEGIDPRPLPWNEQAFRLDAGLKSGTRWWFCAGLAHSQEEVSQIPATLMDLRPNQRVLDMCAAPGGKTAQIAFAMRNRGTLIANDISTERIKALQGNLDRLGVANVTTVCSDASNWPAAAGQYDRILVDAPCSSEGTLRRNRPIRGGLGLDLSQRLASRQRALLRKAVQRCRPGGRILYSTCTFAPEENELVVEAILQEYDGRVGLLPARLPGLIAAPGLVYWQGRALDPSLASCLRLWPHHNDTGGFFVAVLKKDGQAPAEPEPVAIALAPEPDGPWRERLDHRFGLEPGLWQGLRAHRQTRRGPHLIAADHDPPAVPPAAGRGVFFLRTNMRPPKLTTAGALLLGPHATRNRLELTPAERDAYLQRRETRPTGTRTSGLEWGPVLVTYRGYTLGLALFHRSGTLESLFPRRWSGCGSAK